MYEEVVVEKFRLKKSKRSIFLYNNPRGFRKFLLGWCCIFVGRAVVCAAMVAARPFSLFLNCSLRQLIAYARAKNNEALSLSKMLHSTHLREPVKHHPSRPTPKATANN